MEQAYDVKVLAEKLKARGLNLAEDAVMGVVDDLFAFLEESAKLSATPFDDVALVVFPKAKEEIKKLVDKIDGAVGA